jgi:hypothetical protein
VAQEVSLVTVLTPLVVAVLLDIPVLVVVAVAHGMVLLEAVAQAVVAGKDHMDFHGVPLVAVE